MSNNQEAIRRSFPLKRNAASLNLDEENIPGLIKRRKNNEAPRVPAWIAKLQEEALQRRLREKLPESSSVSSSSPSTLPITREETKKRDSALSGLLGLAQDMPKSRGLGVSIRLSVEPEMVVSDGLIICRDANLNHYLNGNKIDLRTYDKLKGLLCARKDPEERVMMSSTVYLGRTIITDGVNHTVDGKKVTTLEHQYLRKMIADRDEDGFMKLYNVIKNL